MTEDINEPAAIRARHQVWFDLTFKLSGWKDYKWWYDYYKALEDLNESNLGV